MSELQEDFLTSGCERINQPCSGSGEFLHPPGEAQSLLGGTIIEEMVKHQGPQTFSVTANTESLQK